MFEFITQIVEAQLDYSGIFTAIAVYIVFMWFMFCLWVLIDARKKFGNIWVAILFMLFVLPLNIPGLILYLIVRPEHEDWTDITAIDGSGEHHYGGVNVPIMHFTGDDGKINMTFGLSVNPKSLNQSDPDMKIDVAWEGERGDMKMSDSQ